MAKSIEYSKKYADDQFEYRHVILPKELAKKLPDPARLLTENEWRALGVQQSLGWVHYEVHAPEPHILLFRRPLNTDPTTGKVLSNVTAAVTNGAAGAAPMQGVAFGGDAKMKENKPAAAAAVGAAKGAVKK